MIFDGDGVIYNTILDEEGEKKRILIKGVEKTLKRLTRKYNLYILTDGPTKIETKKKSLKRMEVLKYFEDIVGTRMFRILKKESPEAFIKALKHWGIKKKATIFIGHDAREVRNAEKAGLKAIKTDNISEITEL